MKISIPKPCEEKLGNMIPNKDGMYCGSCKKNVHDLTKFSNNQIKDIFKKNSEGLCISITQNQIDDFNKLEQATALYFSLKGLRTRVIQTISVVFIALVELTQKSANAQSKIAIESRIKEDSIYKKDKLDILDSAEFTIKVIDYNREPVIGAVIYILDGSGGTTTDIDGIAKLKIKYFNSESTYTIVCQYTGLEEERKTLSIDEKEFKMIMKLDTTKINDIVVVLGYSCVGRVKPKYAILSPTKNGNKREDKKLKSPKQSNRIKNFFRRII